MDCCWLLPFTVDWISKMNTSDLRFNSDFIAIRLLDPMINIAFLSSRNGEEIVIKIMNCWNLFLRNGNLLALGPRNFEYPCDVRRPSG